MISGADIGADYIAPVSAMNKTNVISRSPLPTTVSVEEQAASFVQDHNGD